MWYCVYSGGGAGGHEICARIHHYAAGSVRVCVTDHITYTGERRARACAPIRQSVIIIIHHRIGHTARARAPSSSVTDDRLVWCVSRTRRSGGFPTLIRDVRLCVVCAKSTRSERCENDGIIISHVLHACARARPRETTEYKNTINRAATAASQVAPVCVCVCSARHADKHTRESRRIIARD